MSRVEDLGQSLKEIADRLSQQLEDFEKKRPAAWHLEKVELKVLAFDTSFDVWCGAARFCKSVEYGKSARFVVPSGSRVQTV
jgi:hypothetical protein